MTQGSYIYGICKPKVIIHIRWGYKNTTMPQEKQFVAEMTEKTDPTAHDDVPPVSAFATFSRAQCVKKFWRLYGSGLGVSVAGL